jgi:hypothetical protein
MDACGIPSADRAKRSICPCGGRNTVRVVVEYIAFNDGSIQYVGGRFCYVDRAMIGLDIPVEAIPVQVSIYDLHEPDEIILITFTHTETPKESRSGADIPGRAGGEYLG